MAWTSFAGVDDVKLIVLSRQSRNLGQDCSVSWGLPIPDRDSVTRDSSDDLHGKSWGRRSAHSRTRFYTRHHHRTSRNLWLKAAPMFPTVLMRKSAFLLHDRLALNWSCWRTSLHENQWRPYWNNCSGHKRSLRSASEKMQFSHGGCDTWHCQLQTTRELQQSYRLDQWLHQLGPLRNVEVATSSC